MAFQRPFLISLKRSDSSQKWGFGIKGGKDYGEPLTIQTVAEDSLAERCGLREGDEIIQVGRVNVQDLPLGQVYELLARCGNKIEMFIVREDLFSPRKGKEPPVIKAVVHNPYNSPLSLYSTENIADTLAKQTEVLTEGQFSGEEEEAPENLSFKEKSAVFKLLEEQANQEGSTKSQSRGIPQNTVSKPKVAPPPPPKPKPPSEEHIYNGFDSHHQTHQDQQRTTSRVEYQTTQKVYNQYHHQQEQPVQYQQSSVYQVNSQHRSPGYHSPSLDQYPSPGYSSPVNQYQQHPGYQSPTNYQHSQQVSYQQNSYQHSPQINYQQTQQSYHQQYQTPPKPVSQQPVNQHQPVATQQQLKQSSYQQNQIQNQQSRDQKQQSYQQQQVQQQIQLQSQQQQRQQTSQQQVNQQQRQQQQTKYQQSIAQETPTAVSRAEFKVRPAPPPRNVASKEDRDTMAAVYRQQYEQHLQQVNEQQQLYMNNIEEDDKPRAHIINGNIFEHNSTSGTPITYKAPPAAPPKPHWPPPPSSADSRLPVEAVEPSGMDVGSVWPPRRSTTTDLPRTGFDPAAVRAGQGNGRRCVWPPQSDEMRSGRNTPQSPITGRKIQWNPSPSPPQSRRNLFSPSHSPARRKDIQWPPSSPTGSFEKENLHRQSPRLSRKARFDDYVKEHASINVPQTYRPPPGTQHVEFY
ncbi:mediator of RNA polymerase II transcription subunit 15 isoform X2 [Parasteatoda tepidariorum]|uniref:mediator of RNA polymerase II transcription subunit 15 isoform X1 n=1 Tax=Parasteatoda tepidariorum TaxID=114398 RepID=UPI00077F828C|nr:altered inheritance of mitochondria protein 3 isoform X2 [Parasteatoda tepidariorum]XP_042904564.1 altered inheritance of mitochondria protein 3 isoform X1 [Parasteatoda tepidariorum]